jgi:hypothetical protein
MKCPERDKEHGLPAITAEQATALRLIDTLGRQAYRQLTAGQASAGGVANREHATTTGF